MLNQHTTSRTIKCFVQATLIGLVLVILPGALDAGIQQLFSFLAALAQHSLVLLSSLALTAWQALHPATFGHQHFYLCPLEILVFWPLLTSTVNLG